MDAIMMKNKKPPDGQEGNDKTTGPPTTYV
jgi:hypothetical protein